MLELNSAGGIVFNPANEVLLIQNARSEWSFPKAPITDDSARHTALKIVRDMAGLESEIVGAAGQSSYEHFSLSRMRPVKNHILWYVMRTPDQLNLNSDYNFRGADFFPMAQALERVTYSLDKSILMLAYQVMSDDPDELA